MKNYIVKESPMEIKLMLASRTTNTVMQYVWGIIMFYVFNDWVSALLGYFFPTTYFDFIINLYKKMHIDTVQLSEIAKRIPQPALSSMIYVLIFGGIFILGRSIYTLYYLKTLQSDYPLVLHGFKFFGKAIVLNVLISLFVALWTMLFIIPGIIAIYNYRQAFYILSMDPAKSPLQCIKESSFMMKGNKFNLFKLDISYLLMIIILSIPSILISNFIDTTKLYGLMTYLIFSIPQYIAFASAFLGQAQFFNLLYAGVYEPYRDNMAAKTEYSIHEEMNVTGPVETMPSNDDATDNLILANNQMKIDELKSVAATLGIDINGDYSVDELVSLINNEIRRVSKNSLEGSDN